MASNNIFTGIHAREWVSPTSGIYTINQLIQNHINASSGDPFHEDVVACDWYIMPLLNPDGYEYSHTHDRMWRKNRTPDPTGKNLCIKSINHEILQFDLILNSIGCLI